MKIIVLLTLAFVTYLSSGVEIELSRNSKTDYTIVTPDQPDAGNQFATQELRRFFKSASGAEFQTSVSSKAPNSKRIFLGISPAALNILKEDPRKNLKEQEHVVRTIGNDLFLYGAGTWGDMYAVYDLLENVLGFRWYDARGGVRIPSLENLKLGSLNRKIRFSIPHRNSTGYWIYHRPQAHLFFLRNRQNSALISRFLEMNGVHIPKEEQQHAYGSHMLPSYIPGAGDNHGYIILPWLKNKNYWKTNPEFFGVLRNGKRNGATHLCFSNPELRKELTANILENMRRQPDQQVFDVSQHDSPGRFCYCKDCLALEKKYDTIGAPMFDYLIELSKSVQKNYPNNKISFLVYRKGQTQRPPKNLQKLPENLMPVFAPIDDDFSKNFLDPVNSDSRKDMESWGKLASTMSIWYYPNPYSGDITPPLGNIGRLVTDIRIMIQSGMTNSSFEHNVGVANMIGFTELQSFLILQLFKDVRQDADQLIDEFMAFEYGPAAPIMRKYLNELETAAKQTTLFMDWNASFNTYTHLTPENLLRWNGYFDEMKKCLGKDTVKQFNVDRVRINLNYAMLMRYNQILKHHPGFSLKADQLAKNIQATFARTIREFYNKGFEIREKYAVNSLKNRLDAALIRAGKEGTPLPEEIFGKIPEERIVQVVPRVNGKILSKDNDAAWGVAACHDKPEPKLPYRAHMYDFIGKKYNPDIGRVNKKQLGAPGKYKFYKVGEINITPNCEFEMGEDSWYHLKADIGEAYEMGSLNRVEFYASLKFEGPAFYPEDNGKSNKVYCDRIVIVKKP